LRDGRFRHGEIEGAAAMADVEDDATLLGGKGRRQKPAVLNDIRELPGHVRRARVAVREDVARPKQIENAAHQVGGLDATDMHHHPGGAS
jgi:hypothetical protein